MVKKISIIIFVGFVLRFILLLIDQFWFYLPQSGQDTKTFDTWAYEILLNNPHTFLETIGNGNYLFSTTGAIVYSIFGRHPFAWAFTLLFFGLGSIYYSYKLTLLITKNIKTANTVAWIISLYPFYAILNVLVLREAFIQFFTIAATYYLCLFFNGRWLKIVGYILCGFVAMTLHSGMISVFVALFFVLLLDKKISILHKIFLCGLLIIGFIVLNATGIGLAKLGGSAESAFEKVSAGTTDKQNAGAVLPLWMEFNGYNVWIIPLRMIAFLFAPLIPPLVRSPRHLLGFIDAFMYLWMLFYAFKNRKDWKNTPISKYLYLLVFFTVFIYNFGNSNFGAYIRHRAKIFPIVVVLGIRSKYALDQKKLALNKKSSETA